MGAYKDENTNNRVLGGLKVKIMASGEVSDLKTSGLFFAIGHEPATKFLDGQLELHSDGYVVTKPGTTQTSVRGVFSAGDVQDKKYRQAVTAIGTGSSTSFISLLHYLNFTLCDHELFLSVILYLHDETCSLGSRVTNKLIYSWSFWHGLITISHMQMDECWFFWDVEPILDQTKLIK